MGKVVFGLALDYRTSKCKVGYLSGYSPTTMADNISIFIVSLMLLVGNSFCIQVEEQGINREGKVFSLFNIVNFENEPCSSTLTTSTGSNRNGTCFTSSECSDKGGNSKGSCAAGFGVCCTFIVDDSGTSQSVTQNNTYIQNPNYPTVYSETTGTSYTINKCCDNICHIRIDFEDFTIVGPSNSAEYDEGGTWSDTAAGGGKCAKDTLVITGPSDANANVPTICGQNTGQHIYVPMGTSASNTATITFSFTDTGSRKYDMKISQIECGASTAPPDGCLQYFTGVSGQITTFNFIDTATTHLASQDYSICFRKEQGYCCNQYTVCDTDPTSFSLFNTAEGYASDKGWSMTVTECSQDYITIDHGTSACTTNVASAGITRTKFCGNAFNILAGKTVLANAPVCQCISPFRVGVVTDATADPNDVTKTDGTQAISRGICLNYNQQPC